MKPRNILRDADALSRREILRLMAIGALTVSALPARAEKTPSGKGTARSVIQIWLSGGPTHLDTFDPKPEAGTEYMGPLRAIPTNVDGVQIGELLPLLAKQADKYSLLRGMTHGNNGHETAAYMVQTGWTPGGTLVHPCLSAVLTQRLIAAGSYKGLIPPYLVLTQPQGRFSEAGFLGQRCKPFATGGDPSQARFTVEGVVSKDLTPERQEARKTLLGQVDALAQAGATMPELAPAAASEREAWELILGPAGKVFDLGQEAKELRDKYGMNPFGQSCLAARRLVESGVPYITINFGGWDHHKQIFPALRQKLPQLDRGVASLLEDLASRGLLESTVVWVGGEFGRTPKVQPEAPWNGGRHHFGQAFSHLVAGGGFRGGSVIGATDKTGDTVKDRPIYPWDLIGSIYERLGLSPEATVPHPSGYAVRVLPPMEAKTPTGGRLKELV